MGIFALSTLLVAGAGIFIFSKVFPNFQPGNKKVQKDLKLMREELEEEAQALLFLETKDLELLASEEEYRNVKRGLTTKIKGKLSTIFHEPVVLFSYKKYLSSSGKDAVLYARAADHEYFFWVKAKGTKVVIDNSLLGTLEKRTVLLGGKGNRMMARINRQEEEYMPVLIEGREVGSIDKARKDQGGSLSTRAFGYVKDDLNPEERAVLMALTIFELVMRRMEAS